MICVRYRRFATLLLAITAFLSVTSAHAQQTGTLRGTVVDPSGATVAAATVSAAAGTSVYTATSHADGQFLVLDLPVGEYLLVVTAPGLASRPSRVSVNHGTTSSLTITVEIEGVRHELVVGAQRLGIAPGLESRLPGTYETIGRDVLETVHPHDVNEVLRKFSGVSVRDEEGLGLRPNIGIRGLNPTRSSKALLLEDGIPLTFAPYGDNASYYHPPIERFDSVEVLKGSGQIAFGPSTVGGVVNYLTPPPPSRLSGTGFATVGNRAFMNANASVGTTRGRVGLLFDGMRKQGDGSRANTHSHLTDVSGKVVATAGGAHVFTIKASYYAEDSRLTYSGLRADEFETAPRQNPFVNDAFEGDRLGGSFAQTSALSDGLLLTTTAYVSSFARDWWRQSSNSAQRPNDSADPECGGMANLTSTCGNEGRLRRYLTMGAETKGRLDLGFSSIEAGVRMHREQQERRQENGATPRARSGVVVENNERDADAFSAFVQPRLAAGAWAVTPGVRLEHVRFSRVNRLANGGEGVGGTATLTQIIPGIGVSATLSDRAVMFGGIHRGFAPPRVEDVIGNSGGVVDLDPELSWNTEFGVRARPFAALTVSGAWFRMDYQNQIVPASVAGGAGAALTNGGRTLHQGVELMARLDSRALRHTTHHAYLRVATTYLPTAKFVDVRTSNIRGFEGVSVTGNRLPYAPRHTTTATLGIAHERWFDVSVEGSAIGAQFADDVNTVTTSADGQLGLIPATLVWNAALNIFIRPSRVTAYVSVKNLADRLYIVDRSRGLLPGAPRLIQAGLRVSF